MNLIPLGEPALRACKEQEGRKLPRIRGKTIALDTETTGLDPFAGARIFGYSYCTDEGEVGWLPKTPETTAWVIAILQDPKMTVVFQNGKFDLKMLTFEGFDLDSLKAEYHDTLAMGVIMEELGAHDLGYMVRRWLGIEVDVKESVQVWMAEHRRELREKLGRDPNFSDVPQKVLVKYAEWDAVHTLKLYFYLLTGIKANFWDLYRNECSLILCTIEMEKRGVLLDMAKVRELRKRAKADLRWIEEQMRQVVGRDFTIKGSGSKKDLLQAITQDLGWEITKTTDKGNPQFDEFGMLSYLDESLHGEVREQSEKMDPRAFIEHIRAKLKAAGLPASQLFVPLLLKWRELDKMITTYYRPFRDRAIPLKSKNREVAVLHGRFNSLTAITGRFSSSEPNLQNIPRILGPRQCFTVRKGFVNYHFDYSQIEMRLYIHYAKDEKLKEALENGEDLHLSTAVDIFEKPADKITKEERKRAKSINFGILYGSGAKRVAETLTRMGIPTTQGEATKYLERYHRAKPTVKKLMWEVKGLLQRRGWIADEYGRRFRVPMKVSYKAINSLIQGCAADVMKFAMVRIWKYLKKHHCRSAILMTIHDEIVLEIHKSEEAKLVPKIKELMEQDSHRFFVPLTCDIEKTSTYWSEKKPA